MNSFGTLFHDKIFSLTVNNIPDISLTCSKFPDISRFSRQVVTLQKTKVIVLYESKVIETESVWANQPSSRLITTDVNSPCARAWLHEHRFMCCSKLQCFSWPDRYISGTLWRLLWFILNISGVCSYKTVHKIKWHHEKLKYHYLENQKKTMIQNHFWAQIRKKLSAGTNLRGKTVDHISRKQN